ncbi:MAG TPA: acetamidase/formamidase family protein [Steroidobacteraceae bacterium]|jgi:acetamidase/formamidase|nr:acetamidase/formamidase family protein [Steroidobacteraceae bacterium]
MKVSIALATVAALGCVFALPALSQEKSGPAAKSRTLRASRHYSLPATPANVQWGWYDPNEKPKLTIHSGDTVSIETISHSLGQIKPGVGMDEIVRLRKENDGGGPHSITGPIFVTEAEPGDTMEVQILKIVPKPDAFNFNVPGKDFPSVGLLAPEFPDGFVSFYKLDLVKMQTQFKPGIVIDLKPFPGTFAVGVDPNEPAAKAGPPIRDAKGRTSTLRPWKNGSNMDLNELQAGSTLYLPVFLKGGLIWTGDSHCRQGNGEVNLTALECAYKEIEIRPIVRKDLKTDWPWAETSTHWIFMGYDEDLNQAMKIAVEQTVQWLATQPIVPMSREEAYALASIVGDCRITQVVDIRKGVHCMVPKAVFIHYKSPANRK